MTSGYSYAKGVVRELSPPYIIFEMLPVLLFAYHDVKSSHMWNGQVQPHGEKNRSFSYSLGHAPTTVRGLHYRPALAQRPAKPWCTFNESGREAYYHDLLHAALQDGGA